MIGRISKTLDVYSQPVGIALSHILVIMVVITLITMMYNHYMGKNIYTLVVWSIIIMMCAMFIVRTMFTCICTKKNNMMTNNIQPEY